MALQPKKLGNALDFPEHAAPPTPGADRLVVWAQTDDSLYVKGDSGTAIKVARGADVVVLGPVDSVPAWVPAGAVILRTA